MTDQTATIRISAECRPDDELANFLTHAAGFLLSVGGSALLLAAVVGKRPAADVLACAVYTATLVGLYAASALSHAFHDLAWRRLFRTVDQACIYLLIAGSFTPIGVALLGAGWWWLLPASMWTLALLGVARVIRVRNQTPRAMLSYGALGWLPVVAIGELANAAPWNMLAWFVAGGLSYTVGTLFLGLDRRVRYFHAVWHLFVIAGSTCHYVAIALLFAAE